MVWVLMFHPTIIPVCLISIGRAAGLPRRRTACVQIEWGTTTFCHIREVQSLLEGSGMQVVALMVDTTLDTLMRLTALPEGTKVGIACTTSRDRKT